MYADHVRNKYNTDATVVFDGHDEGPSTKDIAHLCKTKGKLGTHVLISSETIVVDKINKTNGRSSTSRVRHLGPLAYEQHMPKEMRTA